jgi:DNA-binding protein HU-beta
MTRSQLITKVANDTGISAVEVEKIMDGIFGTIGDVLKAGDKVTIAGFGRFEMRERQTKNFTSQLEPTAIPGFKASGRLKEKVGK